MKEEVSLFFSMICYLPTEQTFLNFQSELSTSDERNAIVYQQISSCTLKMNQDLKPLFV